MTATRETPTFDADGYPTHETIAAIEDWPWQDTNACLDFARAAWHWPDFVRTDLTEPERQLLRAEPDERFVRFATGGWSGNEAVIVALRTNWRISATTWRLSAVGGLHIFQYQDVKP